MGGALSNPIDADTEAKMKEIIKDTVETFAASYPIAYKTALFEKIKADLLAESGESSYQLSSRGPVSESEAASAEPLMTGWLTKEGAIRKSWKKRFFVVRQDYKTDYYADEDAYKNKKEPKGTISPAGCKVVENPENELAERLKATAAKLKVDVSELGKPKSFSPNTFGIMHDTRRCWYITAESPDDMKKWIKMFEFCSQRASGLNNQEEVAKAAYESAFETTLNKAGYSDSWNFNGTEEENLTDLITRKLKAEVLDGVFDKIEGPVKIKSMISEKIEQGVDTVVGTSVNASWSAVSKGVNATRPTLESTLKQSIKPVIEEQNKVTDQVKSKVTGIVDPAIAKHVAPKVAKVLTPLQGPVVKCFTELIAVWSKSVDESIGSLEKGSSESAVFSKLDILPALSSTIETVYKSIDAAAEHLTTLGDDIPALKEVDTVAGLLGNIKDGAASILDNAVFTFEKTFKEEKNGASAKAKTLAKLNHDASQKIEDSLVSFIAGLTSPAVEADVVEPCKELVAPLQDAIPDVAKDFVNIDKVLSNVIDGSIEEAIKTTVKPSVPKFE